MKKEFYIKTRQNYLNLLDDNSIAVLFSGKLIQRSGDQDFQFEANKNFYYLTGINQEEVILVIVKSGKTVKESLFIEKYDEVMSKWVGDKLTPEEATEISGIENIHFLEDFEKELFNTLNNNRKSYFDINKIYLDLERRNDDYYDSQALQFSSQIKIDYPHLIVKNAYNLIVSLRMIKTEEEIELIQESIDVTKLALENLMRNIKPGLYEYQIETFFDSVIKFNGNKDKAFETICAAGKNATILHYIKNNNIAQANELIQFDLGCRTDYYVSDISRAYPISKKFTVRQKEVYEAVLDVNKKCIAYLKPGLTWQDYNNYAIKLITEWLKKLNVITKDEDYINYYWHSIGHSIGLDTHDPSLYNQQIKEGMVITVEPGIYIEEESIGIRIEDNVLITKTGTINLSKDIIKEVKDIEQFMNTK